MNENDGNMTTRRHVTAAHLAARTGLTARYFTGRACEGKIPGAVQPSGPGGAWRFDEARFWVWWNERGREPWYPSMGQRVRDTGGAAISASDWEADNRLRKLIGLPPREN